MPEVPGIAYGRMIYSQCLHPLSISQAISTIPDVLTIDHEFLPFNPSFLRQVAPKLVSPNDEDFRLILIQHLEESLARLLILLSRTCLTRPTHRHLQIVIEHDRVPNLPTHGLVGFLANERTLELHESSHPVLPFLLLQIVFHHPLGEIHTLRMLRLNTTVQASLTIMTLSENHNTLAKNPSLGIILTNERLKENIAHFSKIIIIKQPTRAEEPTDNCS